MGDDTPERTEVIDFSNVSPSLDDRSYPVTADELVERHGDREHERTNAGPVTIRELFDYVGDDTFESADQLSQMSWRGCPARARAGRTTPAGAAPTRP